MSIKLVDTLEPMASFPIAMTENIGFADGKSLQEKYDSGKLVSSAEAPVRVTDGKISLDTVPITKGGTGVTTQEDINKAFISNLEISNSDVTDGTEFVSSYASDKGFADPSDLNKPYKRQFIKVWNYIKGKISSVLGLTATNYGGKAATAGTADTATACSGNSATATKATQDSAGQQIDKTYIKELSISGKTITYTKGDKTTGTLTTQDTTYSAATQSSPGLMSAADKTKLDGIAASANKTTVDSALSSTSTNPVQNKAINTALGNKVDKVSGKGLSTNDFTNTYKTKLDGIAEGANNYALPTANNSTLGGVKTTSTVTSTSGLTACPIINGVPYYKDTNTVYTHPTTEGNKHIPSGGSSGQILRWSSAGTAVWGNDNNITYSNATTTTSGLMSAADKKKLDGIGSTPLSIGSSTGKNLNIGTSEIQAKNNGSVSTLYLNNNGGMVVVNDTNNTTGGLRVKQKMVIPIGEPSQLEDGCIWIER